MTKLVITYAEVVPLMRKRSACFVSSDRTENDAISERYIVKDARFVGRLNQKSAP